MAWTRRRRRGGVTLTEAVNDQLIPLRTATELFFCPGFVCSSCHAGLLLDRESIVQQVPALCVEGMRARPTQRHAATKIICTKSRAACSSGDKRIPPNTCLSATHMYRFAWYTTTRKVAESNAARSRAHGTISPRPRPTSTAPLTSTQKSALGFLP